MSNLSLFVAVFCFVFLFVIYLFFVILFNARLRYIQASIHALVHGHVFQVQLAKNATKAFQLFLSSHKS